MGLLVTGLCKVFNRLIIKKKKSLYFHYGFNCKKNFQDIINDSANNSLMLLNHLLTHKFDDTVTIFVEYFDDSRLEQYQEIAEKVKANNIRLTFVKSHYFASGINRILLHLKSLYHAYQCKYWIVGSGDESMYGKLKCQFIMNLNYFITCKNDFIAGQNDRWSYLDFFLSTSLLHSSLSAAQTGVKLDCCYELGFPRNDTLFHSDKKALIMDWLENELGFQPKKIVVYAPTYRDYEKKHGQSEHRALFGYEMPHLAELLLKHQVCLVAKLHNLTQKEIIEKPDGVVDFKYCYDFSFYDLLAFADCVITDYSSVGYDFLLRDKPLIYNLYDLELYKSDRGLSYEPYEDFCPGMIVKDSESMKKALMNIISDVDDYADQRKRVARLLHKFQDDHSTERVAECVINLLL